MLRSCYGLCRLAPSFLVAPAARTRAPVPGAIAPPKVSPQQDGRLATLQCSPERCIRGRGWQHCARKSGCDMCDKFCYRYCFCRIIIMNMMVVVTVVNRNRRCAFALQRFDSLPVRAGLVCHSASFRSALAQVDVSSILQAFAGEQGCFENLSHRSCHSLFSMSTA